MNTFNLTFQGRVLPGHDPKQVKTGFAELFCLDDPAVVEEVFSGAQVILRSDLDRKSAAEYFSKIKKLGGEAALVESSAFRPEPGQTIIKLLQWAESVDEDHRDPEAPEGDEQAQSIADALRRRHEALVADAGRR